MNLTCNNSWVNIGGNVSNELNQSVSANFSACSETAAQRSPVIDPFEDFYKAAFGSSIFIFAVSLITILANSLLLLIFCIDPLKIFRNPTTYFLIGLAIVDLLTALVQEPIYAACFIILYIKHPSLQKCAPFMQFANYFPSFSITVSLAIVFAFTLTQYIVVSSPLKYGRLVTKKKVFISVVSIYLYAAIFCCLPLMAIPLKAKDAIELFLHRHALVVVTIVFYILLHYTMKRKMATTGNALQNESTSREESKHTQVQQNFVRFMIDNLHYLKFLLDPFVYVWHMPKYRESLSKIFVAKMSLRNRVEMESRTIQLWWKVTTTN